MGITAPNLDRWIPEVQLDSVTKVLDTFFSGNTTSTSKCELSYKLLYYQRPSIH